MKSLILLPLFAVALSAVPIVSGPPTAITGQQSVFSVQGATAPFVWFAVPPGEDTANARKVNDGRPALVTSWQGRPGKWRVWVEDASGRSNEIAINVMSDRQENTQLVADPSAVVPWSEMVQTSPRSVAAKDLLATATPTVVKRVIPSSPDTPVPTGSVGLPATALAPGEDVSNAIASEDGAPVILLPNGDNVVDLAAQLVEPEVPDSLRNPFVRARSANAKPRDFKVLLSALVLGPRSSAVLNDQVHAVNDSVGGTLLRVAEITRDYATLRTGRFLLRIPVDVPTIIRLPN